MSPTSKNEETEAQRVICPEPGKAQMSARSVCFQMPWSYALDYTIFLQSLCSPEFYFLMPRAKTTWTTIAGSAFGGRCPVGPAWTKPWPSWASLGQPDLLGKFSWIYGAPFSFTKGCCRMISEGKGHLKSFNNSVRVLGKRFPACSEHCANH